MAERKPTIFDDDDFRALTPANQLTSLREVDPDFAALSEPNQRTFLAERTGQPLASAPVGGIGRQVQRLMATGAPISSFGALDPLLNQAAGLATPEGLQERGRNLKAGLKLGAAGAVHTGTNLAALWTKLPGAENIPGLAEGVEAGRDVERRLIKSAEPDRGRDLLGQAAEVVGGLAPAVVPGGLAAKALGVIPGFAALEGLSASDRGAKAALKGILRGGALGAVLKYTGTLPAPVRGAAVGATAYALSDEPDTVRRVMDAGAMAILALPGHKRLGPQEVRNALDARAQEALPRAETPAPVEVTPPRAAEPLPPSPTAEPSSPITPPVTAAPRRPETLTQGQMDEISARDAAPPLPPVAPPLPGAVDQVPTSPTRVASPWIPITERVFRPEPVTPETRPLEPAEETALETGAPIAEPQPRPGGNVYSAERLSEATQRHEAAALELDALRRADAPEAAIAAAEVAEASAWADRIEADKGRPELPDVEVSQDWGTSMQPASPPVKPPKDTRARGYKELERTLEEVRLDDPELGLRLPKYPIIDFIKRRGGVDPRSQVAGDLRSLGITSQSHRGFYRKGGRKSLDTFDVANEPFMVGNVRRPDAYGRVGEQELLDLIDNELRGSPLRSEEQLQRIMERKAAAADLRQFLEDAGLEVNKTTVDEILKVRQRVETENQIVEEQERDISRDERLDEPLPEYAEPNDDIPFMRVPMRQGVKAARGAPATIGAGANYVLPRDIANVPPGTPLPRSVVKRGDVLETLARALGQTVQQGSLRPFIKGEPGDVAGVFEKKLNTLKIQKWGDITAASHELFHRLAQDHFDLKGFFSERAARQSARAAGRPFDRAAFKARQDEVRQLSYDRTNAEEGFSEFGRLWLTEKATLPTSAPRALRDFERWLAAQPKKIQKAMIEAQAEMHRYFEQGGEAAMESVFGPNNEAGSVMSSAKDRWIYRNLDDLHGIFVAERTIDPANAGAANGVYARFRLLRSVPQLVEKMWTSGVPRWDGAVGEKIVLSGKGLRDILAPVATSRRELRQFKKYAVARMGQELVAQGRENLLTPEMIRQHLAMETPARRTAFDELVQFNRGVADFAQASGLFNQTQRALWKRDEYAWGLFREMGERAAGRSVADPLSASSGVYALRGSSRNLKDPLSSIMSGPGRLVQLSLENIAKRDLAMLLDRPRGGLMGRRLPPDAKIVRASMAAIEDAITKTARDAGVMLPKGHLTNQGYADFLSIFAGQKKPFGENVMSYLADGKPLYVELYDPLLVNSVGMMRRPVQGTMQNLLFNAPRRFYQRAVTSFPNFWVAQLARDPVMASMTTKTGMQAITSSLRGYAESLRNSPLREELETNLGGIGGLRPAGHEARRADLLRYAHRTQGSPAALLDIANPVNWFRAMERIGVAIEEGPRLGEALRAKRQGASTREQAYLAREVTTDFSMQGAGDVNLWMTASIPFFRAMMASSYRSYRANVTDPSWRGATRARFATMAGLAGAYYLYARNQDWYKNAPRWEQWTKWIFPPINFGTAEEPVMIQPTLPKAYEVGFLGNLVERHMELLIDWSQGNDPSMREYAEDALGMLALNFGVGLPIVLSAGLEQYSNKASFTETPIETMGMSKLQPWARHGPGTSLVLEDLAALGQELPSKYQMSAPRMQAAFRAFIGPYAQYGLLAADSLVYGDAKPDLHWTDLPMVSRVARREGQYSRTTNDFYDFLEQAGQATATYKELFNRGDAAAAQKLYARDPMVPFGPETSRWENAVTGMNKQIDMVRRGPLSGAEKQKRIDRIEEEKQDFMAQRLAEAKRRITGMEKK
jgi:hypothetical protein